jgi:alkylation response protein AidB-like acyl-CoA dehydrogenase
MENISHPSTFIKQEWQQLIRNTAAEAEELEMLHLQQLALIYQQKWFKALVPVTYGGLGLSLPGLIRLQESLSWADGSFGWVFTLCCGAGWFAGFIDKSVAPTIFNGEPCRKRRFKRRSNKNPKRLPDNRGMELCQRRSPCYSFYR